MRMILEESWRWRRVGSRREGRREGVEGEIKLNAQFAGQSCEVGCVDSFTVIRGGKFWWETSHGVKKNVGN